MDNLLKAAFKSQTVLSGILCFICLMAWPIVIGILKEFQGKNEFSCRPKLNEFTRQLCYDKYNSAISPLLTPLDFAGITFGVSGFGWLAVTLLNVWLLRRIRDEENNTIKEKKKDHFYWVFICHICYQLALLVLMMVLFCCYQKLEYHAEYRCFLANTTLTAFIICNDLRYNEKSKVNIAIIVVFSLSIVLSLAAIIHLKLAKQKILEHLQGNLEEHIGEENGNSGPRDVERPKQQDTDDVEGPNIAKSKKHYNFVNSPMEGLPVTALPGIGPVWGAELKKKGIVHASQIYKQFLTMKKDEGIFTAWLQQQCGISAKHATSVYNALLEWSQHHLSE